MKKKNECQLTPKKWTVPPPPYISVTLYLRLSKIEIRQYVKNSYMLISFHIIWFNEGILALAYFEADSLRFMEWFDTLQI